MTHRDTRGEVSIALVAGEPSGDQLGAGLINAIRRRRPHSRFVGVGGPMMAAAGCDILFDMERIGVIGLDGLWRKLPDILNIRRRLLAHIKATQPAAFVGVDAPDFNLSLARRLKRAHGRRPRCIQYVSPTVWAWRGYRIRKIRRAIDHMLALFPFEADYYRRHRVPVTCVGHPMADQISTPDRAAARRRLGCDAGLLIALLPGSRRSEIRRHGRIFLAAARRILRHRPRATFILPFAGAAAADEFARCCQLGKLPVRTVHGNARLALEACDVAILASGTAALEAALLRRPHLVVYRLAAPSYWLMRRLRHTEHYAMPNQLLPRPMVTELIQGQATAANIARETEALLSDPAKTAALEQHFAALHRQLKLDANAAAAAAVLQVVDSAP